MADHNVLRFIMNYSILLTILRTVSANYWTERNRLLNLDSSHSIGSSIVLSDKEREVNKILMNYKFREYDQGFRNPEDFLPAIHFFKSKSKVEQSEIFNFIRKLPKGASLHSHDTALVSSEFVYGLTYKENLYACTVNGRLRLHFFNESVNNICAWKPVQQLRQENSSFNDFLKTQISIIVDNPDTSYPDDNDVWTRFLETFNTVSGLLTFRPIFQEYFYEALKELYEDNVMYLEFRGVLPQVYELNGTTYREWEVVNLYKETLQMFKQNYPDFHGARLIYAPSRNVNNETFANYVKLIRSLKQLYPDFVAGFDLVGQEDKGKPLIEFIPQLLELAKADIKFFFHAAETDWFGTSTDMNLFDAILLNTTRIGHGYGIIKHPQILQEVKNRNIAIEISPISNQVLKLVKDLRNHPGAFFVASGYPVVITCDDPSFWGAKGLSYDWYMAFMAFSSRESDLRLLKQLAMNSILYSSMGEQEMSAVLEQWKRLWDRFLNIMLKEYYIENYFKRYSVNTV